MLRALDEATSFTFVGAELTGRTARLSYRIDGPAAIDLVEVVELPGEVPRDGRSEVALRALHLCAGVSYYKCVAPRLLRFEAGLTAVERRLVEALYDDGLREHAHANRLPIPLPVVIEAEGLAPPDLPSGLPKRSDHSALVPIGGGKDSALVADALPGGALMAVNPAGAHEHLARSLGRELVVARRVLDPELRRLVEAGAPNGHVPVTAINSAVAVLVALATGHDEVVMGLERSASEPTLYVGGHPVNHQFSKSAEAEGLLRDLFAPTGVAYFSLLRGMSELAIAALVGARGLVGDVMSCNRAFATWTPTPESISQRPCGRCPKCLFTALVMAPAAGVDQLRGAYEELPFDDLGLAGGFRHLWAEDGKPFECVGERRESAAAMAWLSELPGWSERPVVAMLGPEARRVVGDVDRAVDDLLRPNAIDLPEHHEAVAEELSAQLAAIRAERAGAAL